MLARLLRKYLSMPRAPLLDLELREQWRRLGLRPGERAGFAQARELEAVRRRGLDDAALAGLFEAFDVARAGELDAAAAKGLANAAATVRDPGCREEVYFGVVDCGNTGRIDRRQFADLWRMVLASWSAVNDVGDGELAHYAEQCFGAAETVDFATFYAHFCAATGQ